MRRPWFAVTAALRYTIDVTAGDRTLTRNVTIEAQALSRVDFRWGAAR